VRETLNPCISFPRNEGEQSRGDVIDSITRGHFVPGVTTVSSIVLSWQVDRRGNSDDESGAALMFEQAKSNGSFCMRDTLSFVLRSIIDKQAAIVEQFENWIT